jgi:chromosome segregation ATPase
MTHEPIRKALAADDHVGRLRKLLAVVDAQISRSAQAQYAHDTRALLTDLDRASAEVQEQARLNGMGSEREAALLAQVDRVTLERDMLVLAEEGAKEAYGVLVQDNRDLEKEVSRLRSLLDGAYASIRNRAALGAEGV